MGPTKTVVLDVVALTRGLISEKDTPFLHGLIHGIGKNNEGAASSATIEPAFPALTCTAQLAYTTGKGAAGHGIVGNGFYDRQYCEVRNWHQSSGLVECPRLWHRLKEEHPGATVFVNGWWHGMHDQGIDFFVNVRPQYLQDGGKKPDIYTHPTDLRHELQGKFGTFPLHRFWGPTTGIEASRWIAESSIHVDKAHDPTLTFVYLPHMDYSLQKFGPADRLHVPADLRQIDALVERLVNYYEGERRARVIILSEYGISPVDRPVCLNKELRRAGWLRIRTECGGETLDCGESPAFAVCDHQIAHVYVRQPSNVERVRTFLATVPGVERVMDGAELDAYYAAKGHGGPGAAAAAGAVAAAGRGPAAAAAADEAGRGAHHAGRGGDLLVIADARSWFAYYYWLRDSDAPDFARCVAIHRKPGYDPAEMLFRFKSPVGFVYLLWKAFLVYALRIRTTVDATPVSATAAESIRGSHGRLPEEEEYKPVLITRRGDLLPGGSGGGGGGSGGGATASIAAEDVCEVIYRHLTG